MRHVAQLVAAGASVAAAAMVVLVLSEVPPPDENTAEWNLGAPTLVDSVRSAGRWAHASLALGASCVLAAAVSVLSRSRRGPSIVRALGHIAFVSALAGATAWFHEAMTTNAQLGPVSTPADTIDAMDAALVSIIVGAAAEAVALGCAGVARLRPPRPPPIAHA